MREAPLYPTQPHNLPNNLNPTIPGSHYAAANTFLNPTTLQGYLTHEKPPSPRTLQQDFTLGPMVVLGGGAASYERGTPLCCSKHYPEPHYPAAKHGLPSAQVHQQRNTI
jgi:hypothetical protein